MTLDLPSLESWLWGSADILRGSIDSSDFKNYILDISIGGVFIEADTRFPVGRELLLKFSLPNRPRPIAFAGKIVWSTARGFGVKFDKVSVLQSDMLKTFVKQKD